MTDSEKLDLILSKMDQMESRMDRMESRMDQMEAKIDRMESRMDRMEAKIDRMESRMDQMESKIDRLESDILNIVAYESDFTGADALIGCVGVFLFVGYKGATGPVIGTGRTRGKRFFLHSGDCKSLVLWVIG